MLCCLGNAVVCFVIATTQPQLQAFTKLYFLITTCSSMIDTLAEGISGIVTKLEVKLNKLEKMMRERDGLEIGIVFVVLMGLLDEDKNVEFSDHSNMKAFGNFATIRSLIITLINFFGGAYAEQLGISVVYYIGMVTPTFFFFFTLFYFKEKRVNLKTLTSPIEKQDVRWFRATLLPFEVLHQDPALPILLHALHAFLPHLLLPNFERHHQLRLDQLGRLVHSKTGLLHSGLRPSR
jgi:hypothetical protein